MIQLSHIVASSTNGVIGRNGDMPWHLPQDLKFFKMITSGHIIVMGRKTFASIGRALPNRLSIVISRQDIDLPENAIAAKSIDEAFELCKQQEKQWGNDVFVIGGGQIYEQTLGLVNRIFLTKIHREIEGDTYYPIDKLDEFTVVSEEVHTEPEHYSFMTLKRR